MSLGNITHDMRAFLVCEYLTSVYFRASSGLATSLAMLIVVLCMLVAVATKGDGLGSKDFIAVHPVLARDVIEVAPPKDVDGAFFIGDKIGGKGLREHWSSAGDLKYRNSRSDASRLEEAAKKYNEEHAGDRSFSNQGERVPVDGAFNMLKTSFTGNMSKPDGGKIVFSAIYACVAVHPKYAADPEPVNKYGHFELINARFVKVVTKNESLSLPAIEIDGETGRPDRVAIPSCSFQTSHKLT